LIYNAVEELREACVYWQGLLGLSDWKIVVKLARIYDMPENTQGQCTWTIERKEAVIKLLDHQDWDPDCLFEQDHEHTLCHELIHLHFAPFFGVAQPDHEVEKEQAINAITHALVRLKELQNA